MDSAASPRSADHDRGDGGLEPGVGIGDHQFGAGQSTGLERAQERGSERAVLGVSDREPADLTAPSGVSPVATTMAWETTRALAVAGPSDPGIAVGGVEEHIGDRGLG